MKCKKCGYEMPRDNRYCFSCGSEIDSSAPVIDFNTRPNKRSVYDYLAYAGIAFLIPYFLFSLGSCNISSPKAKEVKDWTRKDYNNFMEYKEKEYQKRMNDTPLLK
ncbi:zinc ribbon domain-containing protein [Paenibacillus donghaensis]|uniref:Zinc-ribbon domain-containing protein n=1 Tax=Paenibacillus donghaensis TaxID=414771 RepID=A0A2Z2KHN0_9BACL|nr:zinc ribbon domain-containing protein [Paenibacillus donghaensis]ASA22773.1 hypothetical protein B9T62_19390 [Paenibacillus donghaensis]